MSSNHFEPSTSGANPRPSTSQTEDTQSTFSENAAKKLGLKSKYMDLLEDVDAKVDSVNVRENIDRINTLVNRADKLFIGVETAVELYIDAKVFHSATNCLELATSNLDVGEGMFNPLVFAEQFKLKSMSHDITVPWEALYLVAPPVVHSSLSLPAWGPLAGSFTYEADVAAASQQKKQRQPRQRDELAEKKEPMKLSQLDQTQDAVEKIVGTIFMKLRKYYRTNNKQPLNYFAFVVDPKSFAATVENIFHVSFLVNDGHVKLELDGDEPLISPVSSGKENMTANASETEEMKQNIMCIDMATWRDLILVYDIKEAML